MNVIEFASEWNNIRQCRFMEKKHGLTNAFDKRGFNMLMLSAAQTPKLDKFIQLNISVLFTVSRLPIKCSKKRLNYGRWLNINYSVIHSNWEFKILYD